MNELNITIAELEIKENDLLCEITKPTDYGKCPSTSQLLALAKPVEDLGKVVYAIDVLKDLKKSIELNKDRITQIRCK